ncbi:MAG: hypothetical protein NT141_02690 [candidate division WWE3 bacterium]|nr:hypothetical protein [candidate division WWE3 bacterium]
MEYYKFKPTQGQTKIRLRIKELLNSKDFNKDFDEVKSLWNSTTKKDRKRLNKLFLKLAENYFLDMETTGFLFSTLFNFKTNLDDYSDSYLDICQVYDEVDEYLNENFPVDFDIPPSHNPRKRALLNAYPIHIGISPYATKRDVLDYVTKRWELIRDMLNGYIENPPIFRKNKKSERDDFIWSNKEKKAKKIAELVNEKFPEEDLTYSDIPAILRYLEKMKSEN